MSKPEKIPHDKWMGIRYTPHNLHRMVGRVVVSGGTYIRPREVATEAEKQRLERFSKICNDPAFRQKAGINRARKPLRQLVRQAKAQALANKEA